MINYIALFQKNNSLPTSIRLRWKFTYSCMEHISAPPSKNVLSAFQISCKLLSFTWEKKLADDQCFSITKESIYHIKHTYIQPFTTVVDWPEIGSLLEVSTLFYLQILRFYLVRHIFSQICTWNNVTGAYGLFRKL